MSAVTLPHLNLRATRAIVGELPQRRRDLESDRFVRHPVVDEVMRFVAWLIETPLRTRAEGVIVIGPSGSGKTMLAHALLRAHGHRNATELPAQAPAVYVDMAGARHRAEFFARLAESLGIPERTRRDLTKVEAAVMTTLKAARTRVLIVDEVQDLMRSGPSAGRARRDEMLVCIRMLMNAVSIHMVVMGVDGPEGALRAMEEDQHLVTRFDRRVLPRWKVGPELDALLTAIESDMPLRRPSRLGSEAMQERLVALSDGCLRDIARLVRQAAVHSLETGAERISVERLNKVAHCLPHHADPVR